MTIAPGTTGDVGRGITDLGILGVNVDAGRAGGAGSDGHERVPSRSRSGLV